MGGARPDVAGVYGSKFGASGYYLQGTLPQGDYNLVVFARSAVAYQFNNAAIVPIKFTNGLPHRLTADSHVQETPVNGCRHCLSALKSTAQFCNDRGSLRHSNR